MLSQTVGAVRPTVVEEFSYFDRGIWIFAAVLFLYIFVQVCYQFRGILRGVRALLAFPVRDAYTQTEEATRREMDMQTMAVVCRGVLSQTDTVELRTRAVQAEATAARTDAFVQSLLQPPPAPQESIPTPTPTPLVPETAHPPPTVPRPIFACTGGLCYNVPPFVYFSRAGERAHLFERCAGSNAQMTENTAVCVHSTQRWSRGEGDRGPPTQSAGTHRGGPSSIRRMRGFG